jgi:outer membrane protein assembly factor BamB
VDNTHRRVRRPEAPGLVVLDKRTGRLLARERSSKGERIFHSTWSPPSLAPANGRPLVYFVSGDAVVRAFEPLPADANPDQPVELRQVWEFDFDPTAPKTEVARYMQNRRESPSNVYGMPVVVGDRLFVAGGGDYWWGKNEAWLKCVDITQTGDITASGLVWSYPLRKHVFATPAVHEGLAYLGDCEGVLHCVDARTGQAVWEHEASGDFWASPFVADGKVYAGTRRGQFVVLAAGREKRVLATLELRSPINSTPTAANGVLYVATMKELFALARPAADR